MLTYLFPGQGSQMKGIGHNLFERYPKICKQANDILGYCIKTLCLEDPNNQLNLTQFTQPAIFVVNALHFYDKCNTSPCVDYVAGHSLGEYNALLAANVFDFETGLTLVKKRGELMQEATDGSMAAVIGLNQSEIEEMLYNNNLTTVSIANYNSYQQYVLSGPTENFISLQMIVNNLEGATYIPLRVSGAFHTRYMQSAAQKFAEFLRQFTFAIPKLPVLANIDADFHHPATLQEKLSSHISHPVQWNKMINYLLTKKNMHFEEVGPGRVLNGLLQRIKRGE